MFVETAPVYSDVSFAARAMHNNLRLAIARQD